MSKAVVCIYILYTRAHDEAFRLKFNGQLARVTSSRAAAAVTREYDARVLY